MSIVAKPSRNQNCPASIPHCRPNRLPHPPTTSASGETLPKNRRLRGSLRIWGRQPPTGLPACLGNAKTHENRHGGKQGISRWPDFPKTPSRLQSRQPYGRRPHRQQSISNPPIRGSLHKLFPLGHDCPRRLPRPFVMIRARDGGAIASTLRFAQQVASQRNLGTFNQWATCSAGCAVSARFLCT